MDDDFQKLLANKIGNRLRMARKRKRLSRSKLAKHSGMTTRRLKRYETGGDRISVFELEKLATALRLPVTHFVEGCLLCGDE